jgi:hypothetical protein
MPSDMSIHLTQTRVTGTSVEHTEIWVHSLGAHNRAMPGRALLSPEPAVPEAGTWRAVGRDLAVEAARSLEPVIVRLAAAGVGAVVRRAWRAALAGAAPELSAGVRGELPRAPRALPPPAVLQLPDGPAA